MESLTQAEVALLRELWLRDATVRELSEMIYDSATDSKTAAVLKLLQRMMAKGFVDCRRDKRPHIYAASMTQQQYLQLQLQELADEHCDGKLAPLATTLVQAKGFNQRQRRQLRDLINRLWPHDQDQNESKGGDHDA